MDIEYLCSKPDQIKDNVKEGIEKFCEIFSPIESTVYILEDARTKALYCECHIYAQNIVTLGTIDSPLDSENQAEYRANRDVVEDNAAFLQMKEDAKLKRSFSNIVAEYITTFDEEHPLKIIVGQHRFIAISEAYSTENVNQPHGVKVYFGLNTEQRLDVQLISNTNIAVSSDLLDRMLETVKGPQLREWCQKVGLLSNGEDFADRKQRGGKMTVGAARSFIMNYYEGKKVRQIAKEMNMPEDRVREILKISQEPVSLETPIGEEEDSHLGDFIQDDNVPVPADAAAFTLLKEQLVEVLGTLTEREQKVLKLRFGLEDGRARTLEEVGKEFNVTRERIRQIEAKALRKLRHPSRSRKLKDYLD